jgi:hypothetical protein
MLEIDPVSFVTWIMLKCALHLLSFLIYILLICIHEYYFCLTFDLLLRIMLIVICGAIVLSSYFFDYEFFLV